MRRVVLYVENCPRCNAANSRRYIDFDGIAKPFHEIKQTCDKCKLDKTVGVANRRAYPYYWRLSILRNMLDRRPGDLSVMDAYESLILQIERIEIGLIP